MTQQETAQAALSSDADTTTEARRHGGALDLRRRIELIDESNAKQKS